MANIVLRNGKTLVYNGVQAMSVKNGVVSLFPDKMGNHITAYIPLDIIERAEFKKPCKVYRHSKATKKKP